jgi:hypothetical protein
LLIYPTKKPYLDGKNCAQPFLLAMLVEWICHVVVMESGLLVLAVATAGSCCDALLQEQMHQTILLISTLITSFITDNIMLTVTACVLMFQFCISCEY